MQNKERDALKLLAIFWLWNGPATKPNLKDFVKQQKIIISQRTVKDATRYLRYWPAGVTADGWTAVFSMWGDPEAIWQYLLEAVSVAESDRHLAKISSGLANPLIKRHPSLKPLFDAQVLADPTFNRMLACPG